MTNNHENGGEQLPPGIIQMPEKRPYQIAVKPVSFLYEISIDQAIRSETSDYIDLIRVLRNARESDIIQMTINSPGGDLTTGINILNAMADCAAHIITVLDGEAASFAPFLFFAGDDMIVHRNAIMMFHNYSTAVGGKGNELRERQHGIDGLSDRLMHQYCAEFLTEDEINRVREGVDLWFQRDEIDERVKKIMEDRMNKSLQAAESESEGKDDSGSKEPTKIDEKPRLTPREWEMAIDYIEKIRGFEKFGHE